LISAPETLIVRQSTVASDVWMLAAAFWKIHNVDLPFSCILTKTGDQNKSSYRFKPLTWNGSEPGQLRQLIEKCYDREVRNRPTIDDVVHLLRDLLVTSLKEEKFPMKTGGIYFFVYVATVQLRYYPVALEISFFLAPHTDVKNFKFVEFPFSNRSQWTLELIFDRPW
jgi:hypothetical protein